MKTTYLYPVHKNMKAKLVEFGGYQMPVWYTSLKFEHLAVRKTAGCFDVSHMGVMFLSGPGSFSLLEKLSCNDPEKCRNGKMIYSMALNEQGGILDDIMFGQIDDRVMLVVNAGNKDKMLKWILDLKEPEVEVSPKWETHSLLAVQGPESVTKVGQVLGVDVSQYPRFSVQSLNWKDNELVLSRTGYTGEDGFEILIPNIRAVDLWEGLVAQGVIPCGLAARDSLRIEAGLPLYGHELSESITPLETRYQWVVKLNHNFIGRKAIEAKLANPAGYTTVGIQMLDRMIPRADCEIKEGGRVLSGTLSPMADVPIGMAWVPSQIAKVGALLSVDIRGHLYSAKVVDLPFKV